MSADLLRRAASLMRERAEAAAPGPWSPFHAADGFGDDAWHVDGDGGSTTVCDAGPPTLGGRADAAHIASWHPIVAHAVANLLENEAERVERCRHSVAFGGEPLFPPGDDHLAVARTYLGEDQ